MKPVIVLVGRPNVGKSTLFNRLTKTRDALVSDYPGLTRDRNYGLGKVGGRDYIVVDTGGLSGERHEIDTMMAAQAMQAVQEADYLLLLVDAKAGIMPADAEIATRMRASGKPIALLVNKTEGADPDLVSAEYHSLGIPEIYCISAAHGGGIGDMISGVLSRFPDADIEEAEEHDGAIKVAIVGRPNVGKSTLVNRILGEVRVLSYDKPGTTRDSIFIPFQRGDVRYTLIDTAGVRRRARVHEPIEKFSAIKSLQAISAAHVVVMVLDAQQEISEQDTRLLGNIVDSGKALVVAVNKWDGLSQDKRDQIKAMIERKLVFVGFARVHYISALHGSGVGDLFESVSRVYRAATTDLATPLLTRALEQAVAQHAPPLVQGRRIKLRYAHQGGRNPPVIVVHGNQTEAVPAAYRRYLENFFRDEFDLAGTPVRVEFKSGKNPYEHKRNVLSTRQVEKKRRNRRFLRRKMKRNA